MRPSSLEPKTNNRINISNHDEISMISEEYDKLPPSRQSHNLEPVSESREPFSPSMGTVGSSRLKYYSALRTGFK